MASVALNTMPSWPDSSPHSRNVNAMSFYDTLMYDASTPYGAPDPYGAPNAYENTLASLLDTDFPVPASPSRRGVLSRSSSSKSVFGDSTNIFANRTDADAAGSPGDSGGNIFIDHKYAPSDGTESTSDLNESSGDLTESSGDLTESAGDLTESTSDLTESSDEIDAADALETVSSLPGTSGIVFGGTAFATDLATFMTFPTDMTLPIYTTFTTFPAITDKPPALAIAPEGSIDKRPGEMHAPEAERASEEQEAVERANDNQEAVADAQGAHAARVDAERADKEDQHGIAGCSLTEIMSQFYPIPPGLLSPGPSFPPLPPSPSVLPLPPLIDAPIPTFALERAQSPASAIEFITRPHSFATDPAPCDPSCPVTFDSPYPAPSDPRYPAPSDPHSQIEFATTQQDTAAQDGLVAGAQNNGDVEDNGGVENNGGAKNNGVGNNGGARVGSVAEGARDGAVEGAQLISQPTSLATNAENNQTEHPRKAKKSQRKGKVAVEDAIAPRVTANKTAAQPAPHALTAAPASHSVATAAHSAALTSHSDVPEYVEVIEQQRQAKKARRARGTKGRAAVNSAVNAAVGIVASAPVPAARSPTAVVLSAQRTARAQETAAAQGVARSSAAIGNAAAGAAQASREDQSKPPASKSQQVLETSGVAAPPTASMAMSSSMPAPAQAMGMAAASMAPCVTSALQHGYAFSAAAPNAASSAPQPSLSNGSMGSTISSRPPAPPNHASSGSSTGPMLWQALMNGELTIEEMQARLRNDVKSPPALEGARADVLRSVTLSEGPPVAPPSLRSSGIGASSATSTNNMRHAAASSSSTTLGASSAVMRAGSKRSHDDIDSQDPNSVRCEWTHFAKGEPMGPCTHLYNKRNSRDTLKSHVLEHMHMMEPNLCDGIYCQWAHRCRRPKGYCVNLRAVVDHIVEIILDTDKRARY